jgi:glycosyltransferase involved in cell wall biosynthesis
MSSYSEGFPLSLLEAGMAGIPVVCSDIQIFRELFSPKSVSFFRLDDILSLKLAIIHANTFRSSFSKNLSESIAEKYSVEIMGVNYIALYNRGIIS